MTKTTTLGVVVSVPDSEEGRNINSFTLGALSVNPKVQTRVVWVGDWFDPPKETEAATSLINGGADVLMQNTDSSAVLKTAEKMGKRAFGWDSDMSSYGPKAHLGSAVINWAPYYIHTVREVLDGTWKTSPDKIWWGMKEGAIDFVSVAADVPDATKQKLEQVQAGLKDGSLVIWKGPIVDNAGRSAAMTPSPTTSSWAASTSTSRACEGKVPAARRNSSRWRRADAPRRGWRLEARETAAAAPSLWPAAASLQREARNQRKSRKTEIHSIKCIFCGFCDTFAAFALKLSAFLEPPPLAPSP